ncbi:DUF2149 domain-containing protein [Methanobrevibacter filiformis]|uniref:DUF2149 domain-containing protein n=1 Tax=Methanobrevibacter filiformis TaxID=55758 RepID=A0A166AL10_9EURY|nr:DUF2149 domain-containing protein [Methanobrevibacter filiformis]KZX12173.1 hypothetical protein MBFIL_11990 [Methanobrevibacter filiformis]
MPIKRKKRVLNKDSDEDPLSGMANLTDAMLVLAVGFLIFAVMAMSATGSVSSSDSQNSNSLSDTIKEAVDVQTGKDYNGSAKVENGESAGMENVGTVYKDPDSGKLIMVPPAG